MKTSNKPNYIPPRMYVMDHTPSNIDNIYTIKCYVYFVLKKFIDMHFVTTKLRFQSDLP
jgi:hypothetical protein